MRVRVPRRVVRALRREGYAAWPAPKKKDAGGGDFRHWHAGAPGATVDVPGTALQFRDHHDEHRRTAHRPVPPHPAGRSPVGGALPAGAPQRAGRGARCRRRRPGARARAGGRAAPARHGHGGAAAGGRRARRPARRRRRNRPVPRAVAAPPARGPAAARCRRVAPCRQRPRRARVRQGARHRRHGLGAALSGRRPPAGRGEPRRRHLPSLGGPLEQPRAVRPGARTHRPAARPAHARRPPPGRSGDQRGAAGAHARPHGADMRWNVVFENRDHSLHAYAGNGAADIVRELLAHGVAPNVPGEHRDSPLHRAVASRSLATVQALLAGGAKVNVHNAAGAAPLHWAAELGLPDIVHCLLANKARVDARVSVRAPLEG
nr:ankyrin repeat domain-containing protein [Variovorax sp. E3]